MTRQIVSMEEDIYVTPGSYMRKGKQDWWDGRLIGLQPGRWYRAADSHYDVVMHGPRVWIVDWQDEAGNRHLLTYSLDADQRFPNAYCQPHIGAKTISEGGAQ
jgi:hypothetical protein